MLETFAKKSTQQANFHCQSSDFLLAFQTQFLERPPTFKNLNILGRTPKLHKYQLFCQFYSHAYVDTRET